MPPPVRTADAHYHFHIYDYPASVPFKLSPAQPGGLQFYSMVQDLQALVVTATVNQVPNPQLANVGVAVNGDGVARSIQALSFGGPAVLGATPEIVITGGIHAREWVAPEMAYLLAEYLIRNYAHAPVGPYQTNIHNLLQTRRIHILPLVNPNGNRYSVASANQDARLWRKNRRVLPTTAASWLQAVAPGGPTNPPFQNAQINAGACDYDVPEYDPDNGIPPAAPSLHTIPLAINEIGVDLNRNFTTPAYGYSPGPDHSSAHSEEANYFGTEAASEGETQNLEAWLFGLANLGTSIDYHSFGKLILYPTEVSNVLGRVNGNYRRLGEVLQRLLRPSWLWPWQTADYQLGTPRQLVHYDATGTLADHIALQNVAARGFVIELDPDSGQGAAGFMLPPTQIRSVFEKNICGALALITAAGQQTTFQNRTVCCCFNRRTISSGENVYVGWNVFGRGNRLPA